LAFHVPAETIMTALTNVHDDAVLAERMLETIHGAENRLKKERKQSRAKAAQGSATLLASAVEWCGERAFLDIPSLLASVLTRRNDMLVFSCDAFTVSIYMSPLLDLSRVARARQDLTAYVDADGLHLRWRSGGLNLRSREDREAERIFMHLRARPASAAA
jgi:hypothetical protein